MQLEKICPKLKAKAGPQVEINLTVEEEVVEVGDRAPVLMAPMGAGWGNRDAEVVKEETKSPNLLTLLLVVANMGEVVVGAPAVDEPMMPHTVKRMVKEARETSDLKAKVAVAGDAKVIRMTITTKRIMEMKSMAITVRVSMAQSMTPKVVETKRREKEEREDVPSLKQAPVGSKVVAEGTTHMELGQKNQWAQKQNMTRKERRRAAECEEVEGLVTRVALLMEADLL